MNNASAAWQITSLKADETRYPDQKDTEQAYTLEARAENGSGETLTAVLLFDQEEGKVTRDVEVTWGGDSFSLDIASLQSERFTHQEAPAILDKLNLEDFPTRPVDLLDQENWEGQENWKEMVYLLRDHDSDNLKRREQMMRDAAEYICRKYGENTVNVEIREMYRNMGEVVEKHPELLEAAAAAMRELGIEPITQPIRGGTDGSRLSFMGLPCPNLCTGGYNAHSRHEYISVESLDTCTEILIHLASQFA